MEKKAACAALTQRRVKLAVQRAAERAQEQQVPLTAERLAAELNLSVAAFRRLVDEPAEGIGPEIRACLQQADREATAQVMEYALRKGGSASLCALYLKRHAGFPESDGREEDSRPVFWGEQDI